MSQFYSRYIPPSASVKKTGNTEDVNSKRKRGGEAEPYTDDKGGKNRNNKRVKTGLGQKVKENPQNGRVALNEESNPENGHTVLDKYRVSETAKTRDAGADVKFRKKSTQSRNGESLAATVQKDAGQILELTRDDLAVGNTIESQKHANLLSKFSKSKHRIPTDQKTDEPDEGEEEAEIQYGLHPIPQPEAVREQSGKPTYSTLPAWQSSTTKVDRASRKPFEEMGLDKDVLANLRKHDIQKAFPVQSTLIPMLLEQDPETAGDVCVSAATGSGKTLAYVVPIVQALRRNTSVGLRAVIVVPTRELVKQVRETCEICASGSSLRIVTAVGSKSLKDEQDALIEQEEIYDPQEYIKRQEAPIDWLTFNLEKAIESVQEDRPRILPGWIERTSVKADIMITTPGRLVDHLKNTPGFNLDNVEWLVVDEADRLLNESYQEWIEVVIPALISRNATRERDQILSNMHLDLPPRVVRKVLLSATMTQDITKLNGLDLQDPKLVVLRSTEISNNIEPLDNGVPTTLNDLESHVDGTFGLPTLLYESVLTFKDGVDKPLVLLQLLQEQILGAGVNEKESWGDVKSDSDSSESESDFDDASSTSSSSSSTDETSSEDSSDESNSDDEKSKKPEEFADRPKRDDSKVAKSESAPRALVFTRSTASASRLSRLLSLLSPSITPKIATLTRSTASSASSRQALSSFRTGKVSVLIATDRASRGIDVPGLEHVINYDIPGSALTYVHRVGRTARAGREGYAWTLVEHREGRWFWNEIGGKNDQGTIGRSTKVRKTDVVIDDPALKQRYESALRTLGDEVSGP